MALNKYMHPRNPYKTKKPDFKQLAIKYPEFREKVTQNLSGKVILDFKDPEALRVLTIALLKNDFDLIVSLPVDRLIPTVPQRLNYILWLEDIFEQAKDLKGIDIGAGASCIFPLLGCKQNGWSFLASEVDDQNLVFAKKNIQQNNMSDKIAVKKVAEDALLLWLVEDNATYDFCMCNPPFYSDHLEAQGITTSRSDDRPEPMSVSTASEVESISWGGEVKFVTRMIEESLVLKNRIRVYTSLLGKKMNLSLLKDELQRRKITRFSSTEFCQGRTMRWGLAWTFDDTVQFPKSAFKCLKNLKPPITYTISRDNPTVTDYTVQAFTKYMRETFDELKIKYNIIHSGKFYTAMNLQAKENTWSHQRRKRRRKQWEETECFTSLTQSENKGSTETEFDNADKNKMNSDAGTSDEVEHVNKMESGLDCSKTGNGKGDECRVNINKGINDSVSTSKCNKVSNRNVTTLADFTTEEENHVEEEMEAKNENDQNTDQKETGTSVCELCCSKSGADDDKMIDSNSNNNVKQGKELQETSKIENAKLKTGQVCRGCKRKLENTENNEQTLKKKRVDGVLNKTSGKAVSVSAQETSKVNKIVTRSDGSVTELETEVPMEKDTIAVKATASCDKVPDNIDSDIKTNTIVNQSIPSCSGDMPDLIDPSQVTHLRKDVVEEFHKEKEHNREIETSNKDQSKKTKYHNFDESEECLVMFKMILRKEDGIITLTMEYKTGNKEAMHQIMQYFKNKFAAASP